jgi:hypothetical protein
VWRGRSRTGCQELDSPLLDCGGGRGFWVDPWMWIDVTGKKAGPLVLVTVHSGKRVTNVSLKCSRLPYAEMFSILVFFCPAK